MGPSRKGADPEPTVQPQTKLGSSQAGFGSGGPTRLGPPVATITNSGVVQSAPFRGRAQAEQNDSFQSLSG